MTPFWSDGWRPWNPRNHGNDSDSPYNIALIEHRDGEAAHSLLAKKTSEPHVDMFLCPVSRSLIAE